MYHSSKNKIPVPSFPPFLYSLFLCHVLSVLLKDNFLLEIQNYFEFLSIILNFIILILNSDSATSIILNLKYSCSFENFFLQHIFGTKFFFLLDNEGVKCNFFQLISEDDPPYVRPLFEQGSDSDQSLNLSDVNVTPDKSDTSAKKLSRSDSWTFYDTVAGTIAENVDEVDKISSVEEENLEKSFERKVSLIDRNSCASNESHASIQNSLYENLAPPRIDSQQQQPTQLSDTRMQSSKSLLFEFDPYARSEDENVYSNYENNDLMLLEALLANNDSHSADAEEEQEDDDLTHPDVSSTPPEPPKRYDSLPKDECEAEEQPDKVQASNKNPPLLPKLAHLVTKKQPAVPPRKPARKSPAGSSSSPAVTTTTTTTTTTPITTLANNLDENTTSPSSGATKVAEDHRKVSVIQKLKKLRQDSTVHAINSNVISFVKSGSKLLSRTREHIGESGSRSPRMEKPKVNAPHNAVTHKGIVYRYGAA